MRHWLPIFPTAGISVGTGIGLPIGVAEIGVAYIGVNYIGIGPSTAPSGGNFRIVSAGNRRIVSAGNNRIVAP